MEEEKTQRERHDARLAGWISGCTANDTAALHSLYAELSPQLFGLLMRILQRRDLAEEALQETFMRVWERASQYRAERGRAVTWVFAIARHRAFDILRREGHEIALDPDALLVVSDARVAKEKNLGHSPLSLAECRRLRACLDGLSSGQRSSIVLAYFWGRTQEEIAARLETPLGTVKSWVRRGLAGLKRCLEA